MDFTLTSGVFPGGTVVGAYPKSNWPVPGEPSGKPVGEAADTQTKEGELVFTGLAAGEEYWAVAEVGGVWRYVGFAMSAPSQGGNSQEALEALEEDVAGHEAQTTSAHGGIVAGTDSRLTDSRDPKTHAASHASAGGDPITPAAIGAASTAYVETQAGLLIPKSLVDAKGDLLVGTADNTVGRLAVGTDGKVLSAASGEAGGLKWIANNRIQDRTFSLAAPTAAKLGAFFIQVASGETVTLKGVAYKTDSGTCKLKVKRTKEGGEVTEIFKEKEAKSERQEQTPGTALANNDYLSLEAESVASPTFLVVTFFIERTR